MMTRIGIMIAILLLFGAKSMHGQRTNAAAPKSVDGELKPSPEMQRLIDTFSGDWVVRETFELNPSPNRKTRQGSASFHAGPGFSLIEDYRSNGSAGTLRFFALLWWDQTAQVYRLLTCANSDGCSMRGTAKWEGKVLVNSWEQAVQGKTAEFKDSFVDIQPSSFRLVSEGSSNDKTIWRVITEYTRVARK